MVIFSSQNLLIGTIINHHQNQHQFLLNATPTEYPTPPGLNNKLLIYLIKIISHHSLMKNQPQRQRYLSQQEQENNFYLPENVLHQYSENVSYQTVSKSLEYALLVSPKEEEYSITTWNQHHLDFNNINAPIKISLAHHSHTGPSFHKKSITESSTSRYFYLKRREAKERLKSSRIKCALNLVSPSLDGEKQQPKCIALNKTSFSFGSHQTRESIRERKKMVIKKIKKDHPYGVQPIGLEHTTTNPNPIPHLRKKPSLQTPTERKLAQTQFEMRHSDKTPRYQISLKITKISPNKSSSFVSKSAIKRHQNLFEQNSPCQAQNQMRRLGEFKRLSLLISQEKIEPM